MIVLWISTAFIAGLALSSPSIADPYALLAPDDASHSSGWRPPASPTAGLKPFSPVETKDWIQLNRAVTPSGVSTGGMSNMGGMKGMDVKGMAGKPSRNAAPPNDDNSMKGMPGMSGMPGMGTK